jgi:polysaccharide deacetylase 2 family uncharacterized protein YibQ
LTRSRNIFKHPRRNGPNKGWILILVILLAIGISFFLLEKLKKHHSKQVEIAIQTHEVLRMPERKMPDYEMRAYTSSHAPTHHLSKKGSGWAGSGTLAIIVDDMGTSISEAEKLLAINLPITFSIIPGLPKSREIAETVHRKGREVMLHIPMEPQGYPQQRLEANGLLVSLDLEEIAGRTREYLMNIPYVAGANNHMGSRFTEHEDKMGAILGVIKEKGLYFIDSRTTPKSLGVSLARNMGIKAGTRNVFLDNDQNMNAIKDQLNEAARLARKRGGVIAICHPHPETMQALREQMPRLQQEGIVFVSASKIVW